MLCGQWINRVCSVMLCGQWIKRVCSVMLCGQWINRVCSVMLCGQWIKRVCSVMLCGQWINRVCSVMLCGQWINLVYLVIFQASQATGLGTRSAGSSAPSTSSSFTDLHDDVMDGGVAVEDFINTGRTGRRNAVADITDARVAGVTTAGMDFSFDQLSMAGRSQCGHSVLSWA